MVDEAKWKKMENSSSLHLEKNSLQSTSPRFDSIAICEFQLCTFQSSNFVKSWESIRPDNTLFFSWIPAKIRSCQFRNLRQDDCSLTPNLKSVGKICLQNVKNAAQVSAFLKGFFKIILKKD